jgi:hypothetical protein
VSAWGDDTGITWETATNSQREAFALVRLYWYYRMRATGGPDGSELDDEVAEQAAEAAEWFGPILEDRAERAHAPEPDNPIVTYKLVTLDGILLWEYIGLLSDPPAFPLALHELRPLGRVQFWRKIHHREPEMVWERAM